MYNSAQNSTRTQQYTSCDKNTDQQVYHTLHLVRTYQQQQQQQQQQQKLRKQLYSYIMVLSARVCVCLVSATYIVC